MEKLELIVTAFQQRIGEIVSSYETQVAVMRAEITQLMEKEASKEEYAKSLEEKIGEV